MRTVLAVDEMLAHAVRKKLPGEKRIFDHMAMRAKRGAILKTLRELVTAKRC